MPIFTSDHINATAISPAPAAWPCSTTGSITNANTANKSSTTNQPTAMRPVAVCRSLLSARTRSMTTVLATEIDTPNTIPADQLQPKLQPTTQPSNVATRLCP